MATVTKPIALDESFNTTEVTPRNIADVLAEELSRITGRNASQVEYDNTDSGLTADNVQDALDEIAESVPTLPSVDIQTAVDEFETYNGGLLSECKVALSPNQDLHGYAEPWVGGAGKNLLPMTVENLKAWNTSGTWSGNVYTINNATIEILTDDGNNVIGFKVNTSTSVSARTDFKLGTYSANGSYAIGGSSDGDTTTKWCIYSTSHGTDQTQMSIDGIGKFTDTSGDTKTVRLTVFSGATPSNQLFYPFLYIDAGYYTFAPYSNICPISGHTQVEVDVSNPNLIEEMQNGVWLATNGTYSVIAGYCCSKKFRITPNKTYNVFVTADATIGTDNAVLFYDENDNYLGQNTGGIIRSTTVPFTFTAPSNAYYCALDLKVRLSDLLTAEIVADKEQITVNLGGTYYSGTLDVVSGVFTPDTASVDLGTLTWSLTAQGYMNGTGIGSLVKKPASSSDVANIICSALKTVSAFNIYSGGEGIGIHISGEVRVRYDGMSTDVPTFTSAMSGVQLVYELDTPTPIQLSPTMVKALVGENHLSAPLEGQEITESKYKQTFTFDDVIAYIQSLS